MRHHASVMMLPDLVRNSLYCFDWRLPLAGSSRRSSTWRELYNRAGKKKQNYL